MKYQVTRLRRIFMGSAAILAIISSMGAMARAAETRSPFLGDWALTIPSVGAGWLSVVEKDGKLSGSILWGGGSVVPVDGVKIDGDTLTVTRIQRNQQRDASGAMVRTVTTETITATLEGEKLKAVTVKKRQDGTEFGKLAFAGKREPPLPPTPDLAKVKFAAPITLFNGKDLTGWRLTDPRGANGWSAKDGLLVNDAVQVEGTPHKNYGNLRTEAEFTDFNITLEAKVDKAQNSGVYLRGIYEVQVYDSFGRPTDSHNMGAIYSRLTPTEAAEKAPGEWQTLDITLVDRHATVILNGKKIIDNQPLLGCTGGALSSDQTKPGPLYLQGDHTGITYRNIVLRPVVK